MWSMFSVFPRLESGLLSLLSFEKIKKRAISVQVFKVFNNKPGI